MGVVRMDTNQRDIKIIDSEGQELSLLLNKGEVENGKQEKTYLCRKKVKEQ